jgi:hypothetical protein
MLVKKIKSLLINVGLIIASSLLMLGLMEIVLPRLDNFSLEEAVYQIKRPVVQALYGEFDPDLRYTLQKNLKDIRLYYPGKLDYNFETNTYGFRGAEWDFSPDRRNIFILGDSFAFGWGVSFEETVGEQLERKLQSIDPKFQVINLAQSGYSIQEIVRSCEVFKEKLQPESVVYVFCPNDLENTIEPDLKGNYAIEYIPEPDDKDKFPAMRAKNQPDAWNWERIRKGSYLHAFYARFVRPIISKRIRLSLKVDSPPVGYDFPPPLSKVPGAPETKEAYFLAYCLDRLAKQIEGKLYLISTSDKSILYHYDSEQNLRWVLADFSKKNAQSHFLDFESFVRQTSDGKKFYFNYDDHWTVEGHNLAAQMVFQEMQKVYAEK